MIQALKNTRLFLKVRFMTSSRVVRERSRAQALVCIAGGELRGERLPRRLPGHGGRHPRATKPKGLARSPLPESDLDLIRSSFIIDSSKLIVVT
jgi:hypothetical protein